MPLIINKLNKNCITLLSLYWYTMMHGQPSIKFTRDSKYMNYLEGDGCTVMGERGSLVSGEVGTEGRTSQWRSSYGIWGYGVTCWFHLDKSSKFYLLSECCGGKLLQNGGDTFLPGLMAAYPTTQKTSSFRHIGPHLLHTSQLRDVLLLSLYCVFW
jgi:hypothetical protein